MAEYEAEDRRERQEAKIREEKRHLEEKAKTALAENQIETKIDNQKIKDILRNIDQTFNPDGAESAKADDEHESYLVRATDGVGYDGNPDISDTPSGESESKDNLQFEQESEQSDETETDLENRVGTKRRRKRQKTNSLAGKIALF